jgi:radical SAM superfamily enzyme YgiQ (UPF0313 family)
MKVLLINPPNGLYDRKYLAPPLGLLTLASVIRDYGHEPAVLDLNLEVLSDRSLGGDRFYDFALERIACAAPNAVCFTSMCLESHVALELARRVKDASPEVVTIFGGTHFGAIAREVLEDFPFADYVITGEAEDALRAVLDGPPVDGGSLPGNVWYLAGGAPTAGGGAQRRLPLEEIPFPAYDLVDLGRYFTLNPDCLFNYEAGRGCVYKCSFCYSPFHYGDAVRNKPPELVVKDLRRLHALGAKHVFFVQDNLLNSPRWASQLCREITEADLPRTWECYATYPQLKDPIIDQLAGAGCVGVFTGIDAVTQESQVRMNKRFLKDWEATSRKLSSCLERGLLPMCAFILENPGGAPGQIDATVLAAVECVNLGCEIHLNTLSLYNGSSLRRSSPGLTYSYTPVKPEFLLDTPPVVQNNDLAKRWPHLFPYHSTYHDVSEWERFTVKVYTMWALVVGMRKTVYQYIAEEGHSLWEVLAYVDDRLVSSLRETAVPERRLAAILKFSESFLRLPLTPRTRILFRRELAQVILASLDTTRSVSLRVGGAVKDYGLSWFFCLSGEEPGTDLAAEIMLESYLGFESPLTPPKRPAEDYELALRSRNNTIKIYALDREKLGLAAQLSRASERKQPLHMSREHVLQLEQEGWIWPGT